MGIVETDLLTQRVNPELSSQHGGSGDASGKFNKGVGRQVIGLFGANILTLAVVGLSFLAYSKLLSPPEFGLYAMALSAATLSALVLDGGLKTTIIKLKGSLPRDEEASIALLMLLVSLVLIVVLVVAGKTFLSRFAGLKHDVTFVSLYVGITLLSYPFFTIPTAMLERQLKYGHIAWIESIGMMLERAAPALLLIWTSVGLYAFVWALLISRVFRIGVLSTFHRINLFAASRRGMKNSFELFKEGGWIQLGTVSAVVRDNLHTLLVGPLFGKAWIGYYAWALQVCLVSSQIFAQISARVSLPMMAQADTFEERWPKCLYQIRLLAVLTIPMLCAVWIALPTANSYFFSGKWQPALTLIPLFFLRMVPGVATTPLGPLIMVHKGGRVYAIVNILWTIAEILVASFLLKAIGPEGLAWSCAFVVWAGLWLMIRALGQQTIRLSKDVVRKLLKHRSVAFVVPVSICLASFFWYRHRSVEAEPALIFIMAAALVLFSYFLAPELRKLLNNEKT